jgi:thiol-disulfide isomerase/thioredoxin
MNRHLLAGIAGLAALAGVAWAPAWGAGNGTSPLVGKEAPMLSGPGLDGKLMNLAKLKREVTFLKGADGKLLRGAGGKYQTETVDYVLVVNFFATYCVPCIQEIPTFNKLAESYPGKPVRFLYVNVDVEKTPQEVKRFAEQKGIAVEMMFPSVSQAVKSYQIETLPRIVVVDAKGKVHTVITGFHEDLAKQLRQVIAPLLPKAKKA